MSDLRPVAAVVLLLAGIAAGVGVQRAVNPGTPENPYPSLARASEPDAAQAVARVIERDDARALADALPGDLLDNLGQALAPIVDVFEVKFVGAAERNGDTLSAYMVDGRDPRGDRIPRGFVLRVRGDRVVGVN